MVEIDDNQQQADEASYIDIDILPEWYPQLVRRRRWLNVQVWATGLVLFVMMTVLVLRHETVAASQSELAHIEEQRRVTDERLAELDRQQQRLQELSGQAELIAAVGLPLQVTRVLSEIETLMPSGMALKGLGVKTEERRASLTEFARAKRDNKPPPAPGLVMRFSLTGVTRDHAEIEELKPILQSLGLTGEPQPRNVQAVIIQGRPAIEFEMVFEVSLTADSYRAATRSQQ